MNIKVKFEAIRSLAAGGISGAYAPVGAVLEDPARMIMIENNTEGDVFVTTDNTEDQFFVGKGTGRVLDFSSNRDKFSSKFVVAAGTQWYVKQITAPVSGSVYITVIS